MKEYEKSWNFEIIETPYEFVWLEKETPYVNDKINGIEKEYYASGELMCETPYINGKKNGFERKYYAREYNYDGGLLREGQLKSETPYINDKKNGVEKEYDKFGVLISEISYENDVIIKVVKKEKEYYKFGQLKKETSYENGKVNSEKWYDESGNLIDPPLDIDEDEIPF